MNESMDKKACSTEIVQWLQRTYIEVPGTVSVLSKDLFSRYEAHMKQIGAAEMLTIKQIGIIVPKLFDRVKLVQTKSVNKFEGLRLNFESDMQCDHETLIFIAEKSGYFRKSSTDSTTTYGILSGFLVNKNEQLKTITIDLDRSFTISIGGRSVDPSIIGLQGIMADSVFNTNIIFNTVKHATVCCGKLVESKLNTSKFSMVQEWSRLGDENSGQLRRSSMNCSAAVPFANYKDVCTLCRTQTTCIKPYGPEKASQCHDSERESLIKSLFPGADENMIHLLKAQSDICNAPNKDPRGRRWEKDIIQVALTLWNRSPEGYSALRGSGMLFLPSESLLQRYKNCFAQHPGLNENMFIWMYQESKRLHTDKHGGLILDEMAVQEDLQMAFTGGKNTLDGLVDMGEMADNLAILNTHKKDSRIATHVMQFMFLSYDGFRFPFAYFPTMGANTPELYVSVWDSINKLGKYEFVTDYVCLDGASNNRSLQMMHFKSKDDAKVQNFTTINPFRPSQKVTFIMDYSHNIKKLRNNIHSSGDHVSCTRKLQIDNEFIVWNHWMDAFNWDRTHNPVRVHPKLSNDHIFLNKTAKMRNHLAEDVLNKDMLYLMEKYKASLKDGEYLDKTIELLQHTSKVIDLFRDRRPIADVEDPRLETLRSFESWLAKWDDGVSSLSDVSASEKAKRLLSKETYSDIISMIRGFCQICQNRINNQRRSLTPAGLNSDVIENFFCQQRTICHGSNNNPTVHQYKYGINATILGQNAVSKKSNAASKRRSVQPFCFTTPQPLAKKKFIRV